MRLSKGRVRAQLGLLVGLFAFSSVPLPVMAAESNTQVQTESILLSPTNKRYELDAGTTRRDSMKVTNDGKTEYTFVVYARPYSVNSEDYTADFDSSFKNADAYKWVQFEQPSYQIKPGQTIDVAYTIRVPANATPGGHYGVLFAETQPQESTTEGTAILRKKRVGAILYTTVTGEVTTSGSFVGTDVPLLQFSAPLRIAQRVKNSGNTEFEVSHSVIVSDVFGGVKYRTDKRQFVLPDTTRRFVNDWPTPSWIGLYKVEQRAEFLDTKKSSVNYVLLVPVWVYIMIGLLIGGRVLYAVARRKRSA